jgi:hypothetical protein
MTTKHPPIIYVYLGKKLPKYAYSSLDAACDRSGSKVILLTNSKVNDNIDSRITCVKIQSFYDSTEFMKFASKSLMDASFRDGFWLKTTERFFVLEQFVRKEKLTKFYHAELDVMIFDLKELTLGLNSHQAELFIPRDHANRAIASLIYVKRIELLSLLISFVGSNPNASNEMELLAKFLDSYPEIAFALPVGNRNEFSELKPSWHQLSITECGGVIDAAGIGQYLFGIDPRNTTKSVYNMFTNELWGGEPESLEYKFEGNAFMFRNVHDTTDAWWSAYCLHIHSKINQKLENGKAVKIVTRINMGEKSLISLNIGNKIKHFFQAIYVNIGRFVKKRD